MLLLFLLPLLLLLLYLRCCCCRRCSFSICLLFIFGVRTLHVGVGLSLDVAVVVILLIVVRLVVALLVINAFRLHCKFTVASSTSAHAKNARERYKLFAHMANTQINQPEQQQQLHIHTQIHTHTRTPLKAATQIDHKLVCPSRSREEKKRCAN